MYDKQKLLVTSITAMGVWLNLYNTVKLRNECKNIKVTKKDAGGTRSNSGGERLGYLFKK